MNRKFLFLVLLTLAIFLAALILKSGAVAILALPFLIYASLGVINSPEHCELLIRRSVTAKNSAKHGHFIQTLTLKNPSPTAYHLEIQDDLFPSMELLKGNLSQSLTLYAGQEMKLISEFQARRGVYSWHSLHIKLFDPLGFIEQHHVLPAPAKILVKPETIKLRHLPLKPRKTLHTTGNIPARLAGSGTDMWGVREYQFGDQLQRLNWQKIARNPRHLYTNEFEQEEITDIGLILDARRLSNSDLVDAALLEHAIQAVASLAESFLREGNRVGLLVFGKKIIHLFPGYGKVQQNKIMWSLTLCEQRPYLSFNQLQYFPFRLFPARTQLILVSPYTSPDLSGYTHLRANGYPLLLISPDPVDYWKKKNAETAHRDAIFHAAHLDRHVQLQVLSRLGVQVINWQVDQPLNTVLQIALTRTGKYSFLGEQPG
jgi:uncharacterized protein (DUF58 family)